MQKTKTFKKIILDDLKKQGQHSIVKKIRSITYDTYAGGNVVHVGAIDLTKSEREFLEKLLQEYQYGSFDGMTDMYSYDNRDSGKERQAKYVQLRVEYSPKKYASAKEYLKNQWDVTDDKTAQEKASCWYGTMVDRVLNGHYGPYENAEI